MLMASALLLAVTMGIAGCGQKKADAEETQKEEVKTTEEPEEEESTAVSGAAVEPEAAVPANQNLLTGIGG